MGCQGKRLTERLNASVQNPYVRRVSGQAGGQLTCLVGSRPGSSWLDKLSGWLRRVRQLPKGHLSPLPLTLSLRGPHQNFSDNFTLRGFCGSWGKADAGEVGLHHRR